MAGPNVYICDGCVGIASRVERGTVKTGPLKLAKSGLLERCSFCNKSSGDSRVVITGPSAHICSDCLRVCREIMEFQ